MRLFYEKEKKHTYLISHSKDFLLSELGVSIKVELGINTADVLLTSRILYYRQRVDFHLQIKKEAEEIP